MWSFGRKQQAVVENLKRQERTTVPELADAVVEVETDIAGDIESITRNTVRDTLNRLAERDKLTIDEYATQSGAHIYEVVPDDFLGNYGIADLGVPNSDV